MKLYKNSHKWEIEYKKQPIRMHPTKNLKRKGHTCRLQVLQIPPNAAGVHNPLRIPCLPPPMSKYYANDSIQTKLRIDSNFLASPAHQTSHLFSQYVGFYEDLANKCNNIKWRKRKTRALIYIYIYISGVSRM